MRLRIFEYAVIIHPNEKESKDGKKSELIVDVQRVLAKDEGEVTIVASRAIPDMYLDQLDRVEIAVRPF